MNTTRNNPTIDASVSAEASEPHDSEPTDEATGPLDAAQERAASADERRPLQR